MVARDPRGRDCGQPVRKRAAAVTDHARKGQQWITEEFYKMLDAIVRASETGQRQKVAV